MAADGDVTEQFDAAITNIKRCFDQEDFDKALPFCIKASELRPDSSIVRRSRVFALLSLSRWADALQICDKKLESERFDFERAYCLYRLNRFQEALDAVLAGRKADAEEEEDENSRWERLEAQIRYRMGDYKASGDLYKSLYKKDPEDVGLLVNSAASHVSGNQSDKAIAMLRDQHEDLESSYELCFNLGCALIDEGLLDDAETRLEEARKLCMAELLQAEDIPEETADTLEDHEELAAIRVQRAVVLQRRGESDAANELYTRVLRPRPGKGEVDITVLAVACNNVVALRSEGKSLFDSLKRINVASKESLEHKLTRKQNLEIAINKCLLLIQANKMEETRRELQRLRDTYPGHPRVAILQAAIAHADKKSKAEEVLQAYLSEHPGSEEVLLCLAQLYGKQNKHDKAVEALEQLPVKCRAQPKTLEAIVAVYQKQKSRDRAVACLREAMDFWTKQDEASEEKLGAVLRVISRLALQLEAGEIAAEAFQLHLEKVDGGDVEALCGLVRALAGTDVDRAEQYAQRLRVPDYDHLDPEELEKAPIPKIGVVLSRRKGAQADEEKTGDAAEEDATATKKKRVRKRKPRYPKNFDPENPGPAPDPERWLPKRERTEFKKRMRKRDKNLMRGPQGAMVVDENNFRKQGPSTAQVEVSKDSSRRQAARKKQQGKK